MHLTDEQLALVRRAAALLQPRVRPQAYNSSRTGSRSIDSSVPGRSSDDNAGTEHRLGLTSDREVGVVRRFEAK